MDQCQLDLDWYERSSYRHRSQDAANSTLYLSGVRMEDICRSDDAKATAETE